MIHHTSGPRNKNLIGVRKNFVLSCDSQTGDLYTLYSWYTAVLKVNRSKLGT